MPKFEDPRPRIQRFRDAQDSPHAGFQSALGEIRTGGKRGHWIWYVFPQLEGLGSSGPARAFAIRGAGEAREYLRDPDLRSRLLLIATALVEQLRTGTDLAALMGSDIDARKVVSSLTLFGRIASDLNRIEPVDAHESLARVADEVLSRAAAEGYPPCAYTLERLRG